MKANEIEYAVQSFREPEILKAHARINSMAFRQQTKEMIANEMVGVDELTELYRVSLGQPDDQPDEQEAEPVPAVKPGTK